MQQNYPEKPGNIVDITTKEIVGKHNGISKHTIGQRKGLNIGGKNGYAEKPWFVVKKDINSNTIFVSCGECDEMFSESCLVQNFNWIVQLAEKEFSCFVKLRYHQPDQKTKVEVLDEKTIKLTFAEKQKAVSVGQFAVLYDADGVCIGGGVIR